MKLYDVEPSAQTLIDDAAHVGAKQDDKPLNTFGTREKPQSLGDFSYE